MMERYRASPCHALVSSEELAALLDRGHAVDIFDGATGHATRPVARWIGSGTRPTPGPFAGRPIRFSTSGLSPGRRTGATIVIWIESRAKGGRHVTSAKVVRLFP